MTTVLVAMLVQMLAGEVGLEAERDHRAMLPAITKLSRGHDVRITITKHIPMMKTGAWVQARRPWLATLDGNCETPRIFKGNWAGANQYLCNQLVARVRAFLRGQLKSPCNGRPDQWRKSGRSCPRGNGRLKCMRRVRKVNRIARSKYRQIGCGPTLHNYYDTGGGA